MTVSPHGATVIPAPFDRESDHEPFIHNGEMEVAQLLKRHGYHWRYEPRFYPLVYPLTTGRICFGGFTPDFYLPPNSLRPAINLEVTFADHGLPSMSRSQYRANQRRLGIKRLKIELTQEIYHIETILVTYALFMNLRRDNSLVDRLIRNACHRHVRNAA